MHLQGFAVTWQARPHRISRLRIGAAGVVDAGSDGPTGKIWSEVRGGTWASGQMAFDRPDVRVLYGGLTSPDIALVPGEAELVIRGGLGRKDAEDKVPEGSITVEVPVPEDGPWTASVAWLTALDVATAPSHPNGYTPNSLAVDLSEPAIEDGVAKVKVHARVEAAPTPDRVQRLKSYGATVRVRFAVVLARDGDAFRPELETQLAGGIESSDGLRKLPSERLPFEIELGTGRQVAIGGLSGFSLDVRQKGPISGRYMRALTVAVEDERFDPATSRYSAQAALRFTNAGGVTRPAKVDAKVAVSVLALDEGEVVSGRKAWGPLSGPACITYPDMAVDDCPSRPLAWDDAPAAEGTE